MVDQKLLDYVKSVREKGHKDEAIRAHLVKHGYSHELVTEAFLHLNPAKVKKGFPKIILFLVLGVFLISTIGGVIFLLSNLNVPSLNAPSSLQACPNTSLKIYELNDQPVLCVFPDNSKVQMIIENNGRAVIKDVKINIKGSKNNLDENLENLNLFPGDVFTRVINFEDDFGELTKVEITPFVKKESSVISCSANKLVFETIRTC